MNADGVLEIWLNGPGRDLLVRELAQLRRERTA
jgi:hypothetical protein